MNHHHYMSHLTIHTHTHTHTPQISLNYEDDGRSLSSETRAAVEDEVRSLLTAAYARATSLLKTHEHELHALAQVRLRGLTLCEGVRHGVAVCR
jgi:ATP-dependent Zn protease